MDDLIEKMARHIGHAIYLNVEADVKAREMLPTELKAIARAILPVVAEHYAGVAEGERVDLTTSDALLADGAFNFACDHIAAAIRSAK